MAKRKKEYSLNKAKFFLFIISILVIFSVVIVIISLKKEVELTDDMDISKMNAGKYKEQILQMYNKDGMKEKFLVEYDEIQSKIGIYLISNSTSEKESFKNLVDEVNNMLLKKDFSKLEISSPDFWNGTWEITEKGKLKFKFENSSIEPNWINDEEVKDIIIKN